MVRFVTHSTPAGHHYDAVDRPTSRFATKRRSQRARAGLSSLLAKAAARDKLKALESKFGFDLPFDEPVENLSVGVRQRAEILKALYKGADTLILDEPTAVLTPQETEQLFI